ncbi:MAG: bifunctional D-glycero-beta-D-manno-heptose-7-phosphate kinase/D-glycero-beta-D-manno-heptose 1-phosphate adenylyltransferase HldE [Gammaproteobacteria bacterium]|nr:bifunctional D-glycero-beta-D-manno-heptose-7-phosphate kinase/D-glycero-beta-D-manno-heptose 1-phosphate adenylyltransferase HldE [Gammaproteobacteria bacterium]
MMLSLPDYSQAHVLVVGDLMLDRYWHGSTSRISPEAPVPVVHVGNNEERPGGAANVALNIATLGARVTLLGVVGEDEAGRALQAKLEQAKVRCVFVRFPGIDTITKLRIISRHQQLIRLDFEQSLGQFDQSPLLDTYRRQLANVSAVILSDYGKGTLKEVATLIRLAREQHIPVLVDPKGTDFSKYAGASVITPNFGEFTTVVGDCADEDQIVAKGKKLLAELKLEKLLVTRGEHGMSLLDAELPALHLPTQAREVFDVTGAGDTVISVLGASLACDTPWDESTALANLAAGIVVGKLGTAAITESELRLALKSEQEHDMGVVSENDVIAAVADARARGERIVMTNGCFDILHAGHVSYLEAARRLGDRLIVAVNDDDSVRRLKGAERPINQVEDRMAVLAGLASVDWVVPFGEDTPERLICSILPDILVKGGDYKAEDVAGYDCVTANGGEVKILHFVDGRSTSGIIKKIKSL